MTNYTRIAVIALLLGFAGVPVATAQNPIEWIAVNDNWTVGGNWSGGNVPAAGPAGFEFDENAIISNGGTATVDSAVFEQPGQVVLGELEGESGTLIIGNGGQLTTVDVAATSGEVNVGLQGTGHLSVQPGGSLAVASNLINAGEAGSTLTLGGTTPGVATVNVGFAAVWGRNVRVIGPNVNFTALSMELQAENTLTAQITSAAHSALKSTNLAQIGGRLRVEFGGSATPTLGSSWNLIDASAISGQFAEIDGSAAPALPFGQIFEFNTVADGNSVNGMYGRLSVVQKLVLNVNRQTGAVSIVTGPGAVGIDGYSIESSLGAITPANWTSLQSRSVSNWRRSPQNGTANKLAELKPTGSTAITSVAPQPMGNIFHYPAATEFGAEWEDLEFEYYTPDGKITQGIINYTGVKRHNNLVLVVDPATGNAQIQNQSNLSASIDGYKITSDSGSLLPTNGDWLSLDDNNRAGGDWRESNSSDTQLAELKPSGSSPLTGGMQPLDMGQILKTTANGGTQDLAFEYLFPGETAFREGVVVYGALASPSLAADFNDDNVVNGADLTVWRGAFGTTSAGDADGDADSDGADFLTWQRQLGMSVSPAAPAAGVVPEPGCGILVVAATCCLGAGLRRSRSEAAAI